MPRARSLNHAAIADAALAVLDRDGLGALSMRAVAAQLDMGVMALYRYVAGRQEIDLLVTDLIFSAVDPCVEPSLHWQDQVAELTKRAREAINAHPAAVPLLLANHQSSPNAWLWLESVLAAFTKGGFSGQERVVAFRCLTAYVLGTIINESSMPLAGSGTAALAALPADVFPIATETARDASAVTPDEEFELGLAILLRGVGQIPQNTNEPNGASRSRRA